MSTVSRLISGSLASWTRIGLAIVTQTALVPIYLSFWDVEIFGLWIAVQALVSILSTIDFGHQEYIGFELLKQGSEDLKSFGRTMSSSIIIGLIIGLFQIFSILIIIKFDLVVDLLALEKQQNIKNIQDASIVLLLLISQWMIMNSAGGIIYRALAPFGYYARMAWWQLFLTLIITLAPILAIINGAGLLEVGYVIFITSFIFIIPQYIDMFKLLKKHHVKFEKPSIKLGLINFIYSSVLSIRIFLENIRHQGIRLLLTPFIGAVGLAAFTTMRTVSNVTLQGLNTIIHPLMPDLMRFIHLREQKRVETAFATIWIVVVAILAPVVVIVQTIIEPIFVIWTRGQINFDPILFGLLSLSVLVYAVAQPAMSIVIGNNMLKPQIIISALAAIILLGSVFFLIQKIGIVGAGIGLLSAEIIVIISFIRVAKKWLNEHDLSWPSVQCNIALVSIYITAIAIAFLIIFPEAKWLILITSIIFLIINIYRFWTALPSLAIARAKDIIFGIPGIQRLQLFLHTPK